MGIPNHNKLIDMDLYYGHYADISYLVSILLQIGVILVIFWKFMLSELEASDHSICQIVKKSSLDCLSSSLLKIIHLMNINILNFSNQVGHGEYMKVCSVM